MSEPLSTHEIEDVLSSIRRLVSEDLRPALRQTGPVAATAPVPLSRDEGAGKLVLTQALRVVPAEPAVLGFAEPAPQDVVEMPAAPLPEVPPVAEERPLRFDPPPAFTLSAPVDAYDDGWEDEPIGPEASGAAPAFFASARRAPVLVPVAQDAAAPDPFAEEELLWAAGEEVAPETDVAGPEMPEPAVAEAAVAEREARVHWTAEPMSLVGWADEVAEDLAPEEPAPIAFAHTRRAPLSDPLARAWADRAEAEVHADLQAPVAPQTPPPLQARRVEIVPPPLPPVIEPAALPEEKDLILEAEPMDARAGDDVSDHAMDLEAEGDLDPFAEEVMVLEAEVMAGPAVEPEETLILGAGRGIDADADPQPAANFDRPTGRMAGQRPDPQPRAEPAEEARARPGLFDLDDAGIDEEVLRDIVRDIIREELAGTLGERITRNVRKLVRVEINRALTAREFE